MITFYAIVALLFAAWALNGDSLTLRLRLQLGCLFLAGWLLGSGVVDLIRWAA